MRFVVGGTTYLITQEGVIEAVQGIEPDPLRKHVVEVDGVEYPPKQVFAAVTGRLRQGFTTQEAIRVLEKLGFPCYEVHEGTRPTYVAQAPIARRVEDVARELHFEQCLPRVDNCGRWRAHRAEAQERLGLDSILVEDWPLTFKPLTFKLRFIMCSKCGRRVVDATAAVMTWHILRPMVEEHLAYECSVLQGECGYMGVCTRAKTHKGEHAMKPPLPRV